MYVFYYIFTRLCVLLYSLTFYGAIVNVLFYNVTINLLYSNDLHVSISYISSKVMT